MKKTRSIAKVILLSLFLTLFSLNIHAQKVTLSFQNESFENVLKSIKEQTDLSLIFSEQLVDLNRKVSINVNSIQVEEALKQLLKDTNLSFEIKNNKLYLIEKKLSKTIESPTKSKIITGLVIDEKGEPIVGASVVLKGSNTGTITNIDGMFTLEAQEQSQFVISYIGYKQTVLKVGADNNYKVVLEEDSKYLDEIVVVGFGTQKKINLTGAVSVISNKDINNRPVTSAAHALQGLDPALNIGINSG
ncbi:MAG TPA: carboxypeptidase-like regulatory domain-containing protein, partial [Candidatus Cloacimonadota bacterium]|nr:carboxypeptidase-like regulatory domain-containing protein [Candidatus Cloacimonadota bacterium]